MYKRNQSGFAHIAFIIVICVVVLAVLAGVIVDSKRPKGDKNSSTPNQTQPENKPSLVDALLGKSDFYKYDIYPDTSDAPILHLYWGADKSTAIDPSSVQEIEKFGVFENMPIDKCETPKDPGAEWAIHFKPGSLPVYTYAPGTVTNIQDEVVSEEVVVRYGKNYAVKYLHVTNVPSTLKQGDRVEAGTLVGYTQLLVAAPNYEFWELEVNKIIDGKSARTDFPLYYFDDESKATFESLKARSGLSSWFVDESSKSAGWLAYTGKPEAWADLSKLGVNSMGDDYCEFLVANGLMQ